MEITEIEKKAEEYIKSLTPDGWDNFENQPTYGGLQLIKAIYYGYKLGESVANEAIEDLQKKNAELATVCDYNCPVHKLATHNTCLTCPAIRNSPHHDLKDVSDEELQKIIKEAESEMEM